MIDTVKGKYRIVREIARSNDIVYEAQDVVLGRRIALKELNFPAGMQGQARHQRVERFYREARAAGSLTHTNVVAIFDVGEENGRHFIAMEYLEGQNLRDILQARGALPLKEAISVAKQVLDALEYAHAHRVIHRDIKPDNIFILAGGQVKLTDFGIARLTEEPALTSDGQVFGTPSYMSPEQIEGRSIDFRSDIFSLGVVLYEMLTGRKPFTGDSVVSITYAVMNADPPAMVGVPGGIEQVVRRALAKHPASRPATAGQMKQDLMLAETTPAAFFPSSLQPSIYPGGQSSGAWTSLSPVGAPSGRTGAGLPWNAPSGVYAAAQPVPTAGPPPPGLPWGWNQTSGNLVAPPGSALPASAPPGLPVGYSPQAWPGYREPLFVLSPGARTTLLSIVAAILIGVAAAGGVIYFLRGYDQYQATARSERVAALMAQAARAYAQQDYGGAAQLYIQALASNPSANTRSVVSTNLAYSYVQEARLAEKGGDMHSTIQDYRLAEQANPDYGTPHQELSRLLREQGDSAGAAQEQTAAQADGPAADPPTQVPAAPPPESDSAIDGGSQGQNGASGVDPNAYLREREQEAQQLIAEGDSLAASGDTTGAEDKYQQAVEKGAGFPEAETARDRLDQLQSQQSSGDQSGL